jgi:hypothetical protein
VPAVRITLKLWLGLNENKEGRTPFMYEDIKGYMTTGVGNILPLQLALTLPWRHKDGALAHKMEIEREYNRLKALPLEKAGGFAYEKHATLFLDEKALDGLVWNKLQSVNHQLKLRIRDLDQWPLDAEVGLTSMAWAMGEGRIFDGTFPKFVAHIKAQNFAQYELRNGKMELVGGAAKECKMIDSDNPGVAPRNVMNKVLFKNAAEVIRRGLDKDVLYYPQDLSAPYVTHEPCPVCNGTGRK